jgi:hypothetical protein
MNDNLENADKIDMLALLCQGARLNPEPSRALPQRLYRDPANVVRLDGETKCGSCLYSRPGKVGLFCGKGQKFGKRCEFYRIAKK